MELLAMFALIAITAVLIIRPLVTAPRLARPTPHMRDREADRAKATALGAIRELEFDHATGKLSEDDYATLRARYEAKAVEVLSRPTRPAAATDADARIEAEIAMARKRARCASCGQPLPQTARFCPACGTAVPEVTR